MITYGHQLISKEFRNVRHVVQPAEIPVFCLHCLVTYTSLECLTQMFLLRILHGKYLLQGVQISILGHILASAHFYEIFRHIWMQVPLANHLPVISKLLRNHSQKFGCRRQAQSKQLIVDRMDTENDCFKIFEGSRIFSIPFTLYVLPPCQIGEKVLLFQATALRRR